MRKIKLTISYVGTQYNGWQKQKNGLGVQGLVEKAILKVTGEEVELLGAGRTDAGVHALGQVAHFSTNSKMDPQKFYYALNQYLPDDIKVLSSCEVDENFHSRFSVKEKTYLYKFYASEVIMPLKEFDAVKINSKFDYKTAKKALKYFKGMHNFKSFCSTNTNVKNTTRTIYDIKLKKDKNGIYKLFITGNGFLYNMVRIISGTIVEVGLGIKKPKEVLDIFSNEDRKSAGRTMPAKGLTLYEIKYK